MLFHSHLLQVKNESMPLPTPLKTQFSGFLTNLGLSAHRRLRLSIPKPLWPRPTSALPSALGHFGPHCWAECLPGISCISPQIYLIPTALVTVFGIAHKRTTWVSVKLSWTTWNTQSRYRKSPCQIRGYPEPLCKIKNKLKNSEVHHFTCL